MVFQYVMLPQLVDNKTYGTFQTLMYHNHMGKAGRSSIADPCLQGLPIIISMGVFWFCKTVQ